MTKSIATPVRNSLKQIWMANALYVKRKYLLAQMSGVVPRQLRHMPLLPQPYLLTEIYGIGQVADILGESKPLGTNMAVRQCQVCGVPTEDIGNIKITMPHVCLSISVISTVYVR
jgi:hypothetical protein